MYTIVGMGIQGGRIAHQNAAERVASELREEILQGDIAPGAGLSQQSIAERFGVSRIPVRDALQTLAGEGLVRPQSNATAVVTGMSVVELQELYELREAIEPLATQIAVPNVGRADLLTMRKQLEVMEEHTDTRTWLAANADFHAAVYRRAGRPRMIELVEQLRRLVDRYMYLHLEVIGQIDHVTSEHRGILAAVESGDAALAARLTREHLATSHDFILGYLLENQVAAGGVDPIARTAGPRSFGDRARGGGGPRRAPPRPPPPTPLKEPRDETGRDLVTADADAGRPRRIDSSRADDAGTLFDRVLVSEALKQLPPSHREVLHKAHHLRRTTRQIAADLNVTDAAAKSLLHHALHTLRLTMIEMAGDRNDRTTRSRQHGVRSSLPRSDSESPRTG
jgi:DNA-binding GntR family transcriptional regulator